MSRDLATHIRQLSRRGVSPYASVNGEDVVDIPVKACKGRAGASGTTFSGYINLTTGKMRFDCADELGFWLEVDLSEVSALHLHPDAEGGRQAIARLDAAGR